MQAVDARVRAMPDDQVKGVWEALRGQSWAKDAMYGEGLTMDEWCEIVYSEMGLRGIPS